jgi:hypothetical protein
VGRMDWENDVVEGKAEVEVETGSRVVERRMSFRGRRRVGSFMVLEDWEGAGPERVERMFRQSSGPKTSRAWKPGKRMMA